MTPHMNVSGPTRLTPQDLLLSALPGLLSLWKYDQQPETFHRSTALDLVITWSGLQRLVLPNPPTKHLMQLDSVIQDAVFLDVVLLHEFDFDSWQRQMARLDEDWDLGREEAEELEWRTRKAFDELDGTDLLAWYAATRASSDARIQAWLGNMRERCDDAERFLAERPDLFLCLATDLAAVVASSRPGLEETDPLLWETLGKHRRIEAARDEVEVSLSCQAIMANTPNRKKQDDVSSRVGIVRPPDTILPLSQSGIFHLPAAEESKARASGTHFHLVRTRSREVRADAGLDKSRQCTLPAAEQHSGQ